IGAGIITGVSKEVWEYSVSGFPVVERWLGSRTAKGIGRSSTPRYATPLDCIRPTQWEDQWNDELLDLLTVLTYSIEMYPTQAELLTEILQDDLIPTQSFPEPTQAERKVPRT